MCWSLRLAAERGLWKPAEERRLLAPQTSDPESQTRHGDQRS
jgi:hypothetical protein